MDTCFTRHRLNNESIQRRPDDASDTMLSGDTNEIVQGNKTPEQRVHKCLADASRAEQSTASPTLQNSNLCPTCLNYYQRADYDLHSSAAWDCNICHKRLHIAWKERHVARHMSKDSKKFGSRKVVTSRETYYCTICGRVEPLDDQPQHLSEGWNCLVCRQYLHVEWKEKHLARHGEGEGKVILKNMVGSETG